MITYRQLTRGDVESAKYLYDALGWTAYLGDDERLYRAWDNSLFALGAFDDGKFCPYCGMNGTQMTSRMRR